MSGRTVLDKIVVAGWTLCVTALAAAVALRFRDADLIEALGNYPRSLSRPARLFIAGPHLGALVVALPAAFMLLLVRLRAPRVARAIGVATVAVGLAYGAAALAGQRAVRHLVLGDLKRCPCSSPCITSAPRCFCACDDQGRDVAIVSRDGIATYRLDAHGNVAEIVLESIGDRAPLRGVRCEPPAPLGQPCAVSLPTLPP